MNSELEWRERRLHFIGIGGSGMNGLAVVATRLGATVTGSDHLRSHTTDRLADLGIEVAIGHDALNVPHGAEVVYSSAIKPDNVERRRADKLGLRQMRRGELLGEVTALRRCIAVSGSHGKTTTSAMILHVMKRAGTLPSHLIGSPLCDGTPSAGWSMGKWLVVETDESDRTFLEVQPELGVITNIEGEHLSEYGTIDELRRAFGAFAAGCTQLVVPAGLDYGPGGPLEPVATFTVPPATLGSWGSRFEWRGHEVSLVVPGYHNVLNAVAALEASVLTGVDPAAAATALADFPGARRRIEMVGTTASGARVYDDCANHPNTVRTSLAALRTVEPGRIVAVYEPLLYTRTRAMADDVGTALAAADAVVVLDVFAGSEAFAVPRVPRVSGELVATAVRASASDRPVVFAETMSGARDHLEASLTEGDACIVMGWGPEPSLMARDLVGLS